MATKRRRNGRTKLNLNPNAIQKEAGTAWSAFDRSVKSTVHQREFVPSLDLLLEEDRRKQGADDDADDDQDAVDRKLFDYIERRAEAREGLVALATRGSDVDPERLRSAYRAWKLAEQTDNPDPSKRWSNALRQAIQTGDGRIMSELVNQHFSKRNADQWDGLEELVLQMEKVSFTESATKAAMPAQTTTTASSIERVVLDKRDQSIAMSTLELDGIISSISQFDFESRALTADAQAEFIKKCNACVKSACKRDLSPSERAQMELIWRRQLAFYQRSVSLMTTTAASTRPDVHRVQRIPIGPGTRRVPTNRNPPPTQQPDLAFEKAVRDRDEAHTTAATVSRQVSLTSSSASSAGILPPPLPQSNARHDHKRVYAMIPAGQDLRSPPGGWPGVLVTIWLPAHLRILVRGAPTRRHTSPPPPPPPPSSALVVTHYPSAPMMTTTRSMTNVLDQFLQM